MKPMVFDEPARLSQGASATAGALRAYARHTRPGPADGLAAWHRLRAELDAPASRRWTRAGLASGLVTAALAAFLLVRAHPSDPAPTTAASNQGGATGAGGMRGASGNVGTGGSPI